MRRKIVCGTGHRPKKLGGYSTESFSKLVRIASDWLKKNKPDVVISGMALGWDQALAQAAINEGIEVWAAKPFPSQSSKWPEESQREHEAILAKCSKVVNVCDDPYAAWKMQERNKWMVDNSTIVLALWDGSTGGTHNCVKYAESKQKEIVNVYDEFVKKDVPKNIQRSYNLPWSK